VLESYVIFISGYVLEILFSHDTEDGPFMSRPIVPRKKENPVHLMILNR